jgi:hypothetical protein
MALSTPGASPIRMVKRFPIIMSTLAVTDEGKLLIFIDPPINILSIEFPFLLFYMQCEPFSYLQMGQHRNMTDIHVFDHQSASYQQLQSVIGGKANSTKPTELARSEKE